MHLTNDSSTPLHILILRQRHTRRQLLLARLRQSWNHAQEAAQIITSERDARWLLETHRRLAHVDLERIDEVAPTNDLAALPDRAAYSDILAEELSQLLYLDFNDPWFPSFGTVEKSNAADKLVERLIGLNQPQSTALLSVMEAGELCFVGGTSYAHWWSPPILVRLLESPQFDRLPNHRA